MGQASSKARRDEKISDGWSSDKIGGVFPKGCPVTAVSRNPSQLDAFVCGKDEKVYSSWWSEGNAWSGKDDSWGSIGGSFPAGTKVSAVARSPDNLDVFATGADGKVYHSYWYTGGDWSGKVNGWTSLDGEFSPGAEVAAVARTAGNLDLFAIGTDGKVYSAYWFEGGDWSQWRSIGGSFPATAKISAVARSKDNIDLFAVASNGKVYSSWWSTGKDWTGYFSSVGGDFAPGIEVTAVGRSADNLDLFALDKDGKVRHSYWYTDGTWSGIGDDWGTLSDSLSAKTQIAAVAPAAENLDVFACNADGQVLHTAWQKGGDWGSKDAGWDLTSVVQQGEARISAVSRSESNLDAFVCDSDGRVCVTYNAPSS